MKNKRRFGLVFAIIFGLALAVQTTPAQTNFVWTNAAGANWGSGGVWTNESSGAQPLSGGSGNYIVNFAGPAGALNVTNDLGSVAANGFQLNQLNFSNAPVTLFGSNLVFLTGQNLALPALLQNGAGNVTLNVGVALSNNMVFSGLGTGAVTLNSNVVGSGSLLMGGGYALTLNASNSYGGGTFVTNGTVKIGNSYALGTNRAVVIGGAGTLDLNSTDMRTNYVYNVTISGAGVSSNGAVVNNGPTDLVNLGLDNLKLAGDATIGGTKRWGVQNGVDLAGFRLTKVGVAQVGLSGGTVTAGNLDINGGILSFEGGIIVSNGGGVVTINNGGTLLLYGTTAGNITRPIIANGGALTLGSGAGAANSPITLQSNLAVNVTGNYVLNGVIAEAGGSYVLTKAGASSLTLTAANTYSGGTTNSAGVLILSNANALGYGQLVMAGGTLSNILNFATYTNAIVLNSAGTINTLSSNSVTTLSGPISGSQALTINAGVLNALSQVNLFGSNSFSGGLTINAGQVLITNAVALGTGAKTISMTAGSAGTPTLILDGSGGSIVLGTNFSFATSYALGSGAISNAAGNNVINGSVALNGGGGNSLFMASSNTITFNGSISPTTGNSTRSFIMGGSATGVVNGIFTYLNATDLVSLVKQDAGLWILTGNNTNSGSTLITGGTLQVGNGGVTGTLSTNMVTVSNATLAFNRSDIFAVSNAISGNGAVAFNGPGYAILNASNSYTGGTLINSGTVGFASFSALAGIGANISNYFGGALAITGAHTSVATWLASQRLATNSAGAMALVANSAEVVNFGVYSNLYLGAVPGAVVTYSGAYTPINNTYRLGGGGGTLNYASALTGATTLAVGGAGTVVLLASNSYTAGTVVSNASVLGLANNDALGTGGVAVYGFNGRTGSGLSLTNNVTLTNGMALIGTLAGDVRMANSSGSNTLAGPLVVNSSAGLVSFDANGGVFNIGGLVTGGDFTLRGAATGTVTGSISIPGTVSKAEAGLWTIGAAGSTYSWSNLTVQAGTLRMGAANVLPAGSVVTMGLAADASAATLELNGNNQTVAGVATGAGASGAKLIANSSSNAATFTISNVLNYAYAGGIGGNLNLVKDGPGIQAVGNNNYSGSTLIKNGTLQLGTNGTVGTVGLGPVTNNSVLAFNRSDTYTMANPIAGAGVLVQMGSGVTLLSGQNTFTGGLLITNGEAGALIDSGWGAAGNLISVSGGALAVNGTTIQSLGLHPLNAGSFNGGVDVYNPYGAFVLATNLTGGGSLTKLGKGVLILQSTNTYSGGTTVLNGTLRLQAGGGNNLLSTNGALTLAGGTLDLAGSSQTTASLALQGGLVQNGSLTLATSNLSAAAGTAAVDLNLQGSAPLVKIGSGVLSLLGHNTYSGATVLSNGTLAIVSDANIGGSAGSTITFAGGLLGILGTAMPDLGNHLVNYSTFNGGFDIGVPGAIFTLTNVLAGSGSLTKAGPGTLVLDGANSYSGPTIVTAGTLQVDNGGTSGTLGTGNVSNNGSLVFFRSDNYAGLTNGVTGTGAITLRSGVLTYGTSGITNGQLIVADTPGLNATFNLTGSVVRLTQSGNNQFNIGSAPNAVGTLNMSGGLLVASNELWIGGAVSNSRGYFNLTGGSVVVSNYTAVGGRLAGSTGNYGELNISGGAWSNQANNNFTIASLGGNTGRVTVTGGNLYVQNALYVGEGNGAVVTAPAVGTMVIGGGTVYAGNSLMVGQNAAALGALIQTGGVLNVASGEFDMGNANALNYGFYQNSGGIASNANWMQAGRGGMGLIYMLGGTNVINASSQGLLAGMNGSGSSTGVIYIAGGTLRDTGRLGVGWAGSSRAEVTIAGNSSVVLGSGGVEFNQANTTVASLNLNGGTLSTLNIYKNVAGGWSVLNINGGTILAQGSQILMGQGAGGVGALDAAYIYGNGATIDASNFNVTISQNLLAPTGNGVTSIPWSGALGGYVGAPYVAISGGGGTGATAIAQFDFTSGSVTGIVITSAGLGYTSTPTVSLLGGGISSQYVGVAYLSPNISGALIKQGVGALQLTGTNTYAGGSVINNGLLGFATTNALGTGLVTINSGGALAMTGAYGSVAAWLGSTRISPNSSGVLALGAANAAETIDFTTMGGGAYSNLFVGASGSLPVLFTGNLGFYNGNYRLGGGGGTLAINNDLGGNSLIIGALGTSTTNTVALNGNLFFPNGITVNSNVTLSLTGPAFGTFNLNNATLQVRGTALNGLTFNPAMVGNVTLDINNAGNLFTVPDNLTVGGALTKAGAGTLVLGGSNGIAGNVTVLAGALRLTSGDAMDGASSNVTVASGAALQLQGGITTMRSDLLTLNGTGLANDGALRSLSGSNTWAGIVTLGSAARINADADLLTLSGTVTNGANLLTFGGAGNTLVSGAILGGAGGLSKDGSGTLTLTGTNLYTGTTTINAGGLVLDFSQPGAPLNNIINNTALAMGYNALGTNATLTVIGQGAGITTQSFNGVTVNPGNNYIVASNYNGGGATILNLGAITRATGGGLLDLTLPGGAGKITTSSATNTVGIFDAWVTVNSQDWATLSGTSLTNFVNYTPITTILPSLNTLVTKIDSNSSPILSLAGLTLNKALLVNDPTGDHLIDMGSQTLRLGSPGALMLAAGSGALTIGSFQNDGNLSASSDLTLINYSTNFLVINSAYTAGGSSLTVAGGGPVMFNGNNTNAGVTYFNGGAVTLTGLNSLSGAVNIRGGTVTLAPGSSNVLGAVTLQDSSVLNISGPSSLNANTLAVGSLAGDRSTVLINDYATMGKMLIGNGVGSAGAVVQNAGSVNAGFGAGGADVFSLGLGGYGYYQMNGGTLLTGQFAPGGSVANSTGVFEQYGGNATVQGQYFLLGWGGNSRGVVNLFGGTLTYANNTNTTALSMGYSGLNSYAAINMLGGSTFDTTGGTNALPLDMMRTAGGLASVINLNAGTMVASQIKASNAGTTLLNFNGGTLLVSNNTAFSNAFITGLTAATIYGGGATIDTQSNANVIVSQNLNGPTGYGVTNIALAANGTGYIGAPVVLLSGGSGTGATAIAQVDLTRGQVTNILITSYGSGYLPTDALTVQLVGGGFTSAAVPGTINWATNVNNGGLTKWGYGALTLTGTNTYGGTSIINNGVLVFQPGATTTNSIGGLGGIGAMQHNGPGLTILSGDSSGFGGTATINTGTVQFATLNSLPTMSLGGVLVANQGVAALGYTGIGIAGSLLNFNPSSSGIIAFTPASSTDSFSFAGAGLSNAFFGSMTSATFGGTYTPYNSAYNLTGVRGSTLTYTNAIGGGSAVAIGSGTGASSGTVMFTSANNSYTGATIINSNSTLLAGAANVIGSLSAVTLSNGAVFNVAGNNQSIGSLAGLGSLINTNAKMTLTVGLNNTSTIFGGMISGAQNLVKSGSGTWTLTNSSFYTGATIVNGGTLQLTPTGTNFAGLWETASNTASIWAPAPLGKIAVATYPRFAETNFGTSSGYPASWPSNFPGNVTIGYQGYVYNNSGSNVTWTFAANIDDGSQLLIDGNLVLNTAGNATLMTNITLTPGAHQIDYRMQNGSGGAGSYGIFGMGTGAGSIGFGYDPLGRGQAIAGNYIIPSDPSNGTFFTTAAGVLPAATPLYISSGATVDLNGAVQNVSGLFDYAGGGGLITNTAAAGATIQIATLAGSNSTFSGNITDGAASNSVALWIGGSGTQVLAGTNTYHGGTVIAGGVLQFATNTAISPYSNILINVNGTLANAGAYTNVTDWLNTGSIASNSAGSLAFTPSANLNESINLATAGGGVYSNLYLGALGNIVFNGTVTPLAGVTRLGGGGGTLTMVNPITAGTVAIGGGLGTVVLTNALDTYSSTILNAGTLQITSDAALGTAVSGQTNITFALGGTLQAGAANIALAAARTLLVASNALGTLDNNGFNFTVNGNIGGTGTLVTVGSGLTTLGGLTNTVMGIMARSGTLAFAPGSSNNIAGGSSSNFYGLQVAPLLGDRAIVTFNPTAGQTNIILGTLRVGNATNSAGAVYQSGGLVLQNGPQANQDFAIGSGGGYGYYKMTGGTLVGQQMEVSGVNTGAGGVGVMDILGGTVSPQLYFMIGRSANGIGVVTVANGGVLNGSLNNTGIAFGWDANANGYGVLNVLNGGFVNAGIGGKTLDLGANGAGNTGIMNLNSGGTAMVYQITRSQAGVGILNLNGGLLIASAGANGTLINNNLTAAYVYSGGAQISNSVNSIVQQALLAPTGYGVTGIGLADGGTNYLGAPAVMITGGSGQGATAIAQINAAGVITNILITSAGSGYQAGDALTVKLSGGGASFNGTVGMVTLGANASGGLLKTGTGTLTLGGNNTYTDVTTVAAGNLQLGSGGTLGALANPNVTFLSTNSWLGFGRSDLITNSLAVRTPNGNITQVVQNGSGILVLTNTTLNFNQAAVSNGLILFASAAAMPTNTNGKGGVLLSSGGGVLVSNIYGSINGWLNSGALSLASNASGGLLALTTGVNTENVNWVTAAGTYSNMYLGVAPNNTATFLGTLTPVGTNYLVGGGGGTLVIGNDNAFTDLNALTNRSVTFGSGSLTSAVYVLGPQSYTGGTTITNALVSVGADNNLGYGGITMNNGSRLQITNAPNFSTIKTLTINMGATVNALDIGAGSTATLYGAVSAAGTGADLYKSGGGTLIFNGNAVNIGATGNRFAVEGGALIVDTNALVTAAESYVMAGYLGNGTILVRANGQLIVTNALYLADQGGSLGTLTIQDNALVQVNGVTAIGNGGTGTLNINGGVFSVNNLNVPLGAGTGTNNLNGGVELIRGTYITKAGGTGVFNFNGGTLRAGNNFVFSNGFNAATINGAPVLDSSNFTVTLNQAFTGTGTLTKVGSGTVIVNSASNTFASIQDNAGSIQFAATNGMTPGRTLTINAGAAAGYSSANAAGLDQAFLLRVASNSVGTVALGSNSISNLDFSLAGANLPNVSLGAIGGTWTNSGVFTNFGNIYRLGGGGGTLVLTNNMLTGAGTNLVAFGSGSGGTLILTGTNTWTSTAVNGGVVLYGSTNAMGTNVTVASGGAFGNNGALDTNLFVRINPASAGAFALVTNNAAGGINLGAYPNLSVGAANGSWTNDGNILPFGTTYQLGGGGGTLVITNNTLLQGLGTNLVAFSGVNSGNLVLTGTNTYGGGTWIGALGTTTVTTVSLGTGNITNNGFLTVNNRGLGAGTLANNLSGSGSLLFTNATATNLMVVLTGNNTYTGLTVLAANSFLVLSNTTGGTALSGNVQVGNDPTQNAYLRLGANQQFGSNTVLSFVGAYGRMDLLGTTQTVAGLNDALAGGLIENTGNSLAQMLIADTNAAPGQVIISNTANYVYAGYLRDRGGVVATNSRISIVKDGPGQQTLSGANITYTGPTVVQNGILSLSNTTAFASPVTVNGGQLLLASAGNTTVQNQPVTINAANGLIFAGGTAFSLGSLAGNSNASIPLWSQTGGGVTLTVGGNNSNTTYAGSLTDVGPGNFYQGSLVKNGSGTMTLTGTNTYNGYTLLNAGILQADAGTGLSPYANVTINGGSLASVSGLITNTLGLGANQLNILSGGFSAVGTPTTVAIGGTVSPTLLRWGLPSFVPTTFVLNETNASSVLTLVNNMDLFGSNVAVFANATNVNALAVMSGAISDSVGTGSFVKRGAGTLVLAGANTYTGGTYIAGGNLAVTNDLLGAVGAPLYLTNNGALEASGNFTLNNRAISVQTGGGKINVDAGVTLTITNNILATGGALTKAGLGTLLLTAGPTQSQLTNGLNANAGTLLLTNNNIWLNNSAANIGQNVGDAGTVILGNNAVWSSTNMPFNVAGPILSVGNAGRGTLIIQGNAIITNRLYVGNAAGSAGAVYQRGGTSVWWNGQASDGRIGMTGYGYYEMAGGSLAFEGYTQIGHDFTGVGVMSQLGGSVLQTNLLTADFALSRGGVGVYNMLGGSFVTPNSGINLGEASDNGISNGVAIFNMLGGSALISGGNVSMGNRTNMLAVLNLDGGVLTANQIARSTTATGTLALVNFNGGTLQARQNGALFGTGAAAPDGTYIYANGATLDASNFMASVPVNLLAPQGQGVTNISLGSPTLAGYVGSPYVQISGGGGTGATAFAQYDSVAGLVTGIVMTSYGYGYTGDPTVTLVGNITNTLTTMSRAANTSGSLTVMGGTNGVLFLSGANTYAGGTIINSGNLLFTGPLALPASGNVLINNGGSLGATNANSPYTTASGWLASGRISLLSSGTLALAYNSLASETIDFGGTGYARLSLGAVSGMTVTNGATLLPNNLTYRLGGGWGTLVVSNNLQSGTALNVFGSGSGGTLVLSGNNNFSSITLNPIGVLQVNSVGALGGVTGLLVPYGATLADGAAMDNTFLGLVSTASSGTLALALSTPNPLDFNAAGLPTVSLGAVGTVTNSSLITPNGGVYRLGGGGGGGTLVLTNNNALTGASQSLLAFASGSGGSLVLSGTNDYAGGTWIGALGTTAVSTVSLGSGAVTNNGVLMFSQTANGTNGNVIGGTGMLLFTNTGLVTLSGNNSYSGGTVVNSNSWLSINNANALGVGAVTLTNSGLLRFGGGITVTNAVTIYGGDGVGKQSDYHGSLQSTNGNNVWAGLITLGTASGRIDVDAGQLRVVGGIVGTTSLILQPQVVGATLIVDTQPINLPGQTVTFTGSGTNLLNVGGNNFANVNFNYGSDVTKIGVLNALPINAAMTLGGNAGGDTTSPQFWLNGYDQTIGSLTVACSNQISLNTINVGTNTLTINGNITEGSMLLSNSTQRLAVVGPGALIVNKVGGVIQIGNNTNDISSGAAAGNRATNDMSLLGTFVANLGSTGRVAIGDPNVTAGIGDVGDRSTMLLATNSTIIAGALTLGEINTYDSLQTLLLGAGLNVMNVSTVSVAAVQAGRANGLIQFAGATGSLALSNTVGGRAELLVGETVNAQTANAITGTVNLAGHQSDLYLGDLMLGNALPPSGLNNTGDRVGSFLFDTGTLDVTNILMGSRAGNFLTNNIANSYGFLTISGGVSRIGQLQMATNYTWFGSASSNGSSKANAYVNLLGGSVTVSNGINRGLGGGSNGVAVVNLAGASLDMNGSAIGGAGLLYGVTFNTSNGVLQNLAQLNGGLTPLVKVSGGTLMMLGSNTYSGGTLISGGLLQLGDGTTRNGFLLGPITNNAQLSVANPFDQTLSGVISGPGSLTKSGAGVLTLTALNTFTGDTTNNAGTLRLGDGVTLNGVISNNIVNNASLMFANPNSQTYGGLISGSGSLTKMGAGLLTLTTANAYLGGTIISNGTLRLGLNNALPSTTTLYAGVAGSLDLSGNNQLVNGVDGYLGIITNSGAGSTLTVNLLNTQTFGGTLAGPSHLTVQGGGQLNMTGMTSPTYTGNVSISNATVLVQGSLTTGGLIQVFNGGTLGGTGALGNVQVTNGGIYSPGYVSPFNSGTQVAVSLTLGGGLFNAGLMTTNNYSRLVATSGFQLVAGTTNYLHLSLSNYALVSNGSYLLVQDNSANAWNGNQFVLMDPLSPMNGWTLTNGATFFAVGGGSSTNLFRIAYDFDTASGLTGAGNDILLTAIPEPTALNLLVVIGAAYGLRRRLLRKCRQPS